MTTDRTKRIYYSLRFSLGITFVVIVILTSILLGLTTYCSVRSFIRQGIREELRNAAGIAALHIDAETHENLTQRSDEETAGYARIRKYLQRVRDDCRNIRFVYTIRKNEKGQIIFVVDAEERPEEMSHIGDVYKNPSPQMLAAFTKPYKVQVESQFFTDKWGTYLSSYAPVLFENGELEAVLGMDISAHEILNYERRHLSIIVMICVAISSFVVGLSIFFARMISRPMMLLETDMSRIQKFDLDNKIRISSHISEVVKMKNAVDNMKTGLRSFRKYVPADLVADLIKLQKEAVLSAEKRELTVFFSDIAGFTALSENLTPEQLAENLGIYFKGMTRAILQNGGTVDKYIGDSIMAFWGAPYHLENHAVLGCRAALQCQRHVDAIAKKWLEEGMPSFETRIGLNTGEVIVGNIGYEERLNYTVIGDNVNLASRLEGLNKYYGTRIIMSESTYAQAREHLQARLIDIVAVKGKTKGVMIYELISEKNNIDRELGQFIELFNQGMAFYLERKWPKAIEIFRETCRRNPHDTPSHILLNRCSEYERTPPPDNWSGVVAVREK